MTRNITEIARAALIAARADVQHAMAQFTLTLAEWDTSDSPDGLAMVEKLRSTSFEVICASHALWALQPGPFASDADNRTFTLATYIATHYGM